MFSVLRVACYVLRVTCRVSGGACGKSLRSNALKIASDAKTPSAQWFAEEDIFSIISARKHRGRLEARRRQEVLC